MPDPTARERAIRAAYRVEHQLYALETETVAQIRAELELARKAVIATLATAEKGWQIAQAQSLLVEIERQLREWSATAAGLATGRLHDVTDLGVEQVLSALRAGGSVAVGVGPMISRDFVAVASQTMPYLISGIGDKVLRDVTGILIQAVLAQRTPLDAMHEIGTLTGKGVFGSAFVRGEMIVRTEYGRIAQQANQSTLSMLAADQTTLAPDERGVEHALPDETTLRKEWSAVIDFRTRRTHAAADGQRRKVDEMFDIGGHPGMYPHDPRLPAHESIACRCISVPFDEKWDLPDEKPGLADAIDRLAAQTEFNKPEEALPWDMLVGPNSVIKGSAQRAVPVTGVPGTLASGEGLLGRYFVLYGPDGKAAAVAVGNSFTPKGFTAVLELRVRAGLERLGYATKLYDAIQDTTPYNLYMAVGRGNTPAGHRFVTEWLRHRANG